ncbi:thioredoxin reductase (NADPH) [Pullulanibacillus pueri]|uniref:Ferredoxin--NADP reductase n=1 Tax=Pullulanibacillus pueri TaxID=1437324 RepID=A0A8J2ZSP5_9BACL|nr:NAD(P)/FAD-dependent oxidoreductase [Pullulanibacillus pueri]MBM7680370.1 thioredoxin reductase (NADPH) [Pullulanibacillus pueri]GGH75410.1 ferredoxin--NADP reductase 2 [Pullulanibacillus pueri]
MSQEREIFDVTIIGGGPTGLFTAFYSGLRQMKTKIIESMPQLGGQLAALYPEKIIYDVAGFPEIKAQDLVNQLVEQTRRFSPTIVLGQSVHSLERDEEGIITLTSDNGESHYTKTVIITAGVGAFQPRRVEIDKADYYEEKNLHYFVTDLKQFAGRKVLISGGGDSAVDWSNMLEPIAEKVTLVHRRDKFRAHERSVEQLENSSVDIKTPYIVSDFIGDDDGIKAVVLQQPRGEEKVIVEVDDVIVNHGFISALGPIKEWGLDIEKNSIVVNTKMETAIEGVYAAGDVTTYPGKVNLIATGFGEGPTAVNNAKSYMDPKARTQPMHSTAMFGNK